MVDNGTQSTDVRETNRELDERYDNEQWIPCVQCGTPLMRDPDTNEPQPCPTCASNRQTTPLALGITAIAGMVLAAALCLAFAIWLTL